MVQADMCLPGVGRRGCLVAMHSQQYRLPARFLADGGAVAAAQADRGGVGADLANDIYDNDMR